MEEQIQEEQPLIESHFLKMIKNRIKRKKNVTMIITGRTGSGKSYSALALAQKIDPTFDISRVAFTGLEFINLVEKEENLPTGSVIVFDEGHVSLGSRDWYSVQNKAMNHVLSTFRYKQLIVIFTTPDLSFIDSQTKKLFNFYLETRSIDRETKLATLRPFLIMYDREGKVYYKYPTIINKEGIFKLTKIKIKKPIQKLCNQYEKKKQAFTRNRYLELKQTLSGGSSLKSTIPDTNERKYYLMKKSMPDMKDDEIAMLMEKKIAQIRYIKQKLKEKKLIDDHGNLLVVEGGGL